MSRVITARIRAEQYDRLAEYAKKNGMTVSKAIEQAVRWMLLLSDGRR